jgi:hypothetical protein
MESSDIRAAVQFLREGGHTVVALVGVTRSQFKAGLVQHVTGAFTCMVSVSLHLKMHSRDWQVPPLAGS